MSSSGGWCFFAFALICASASFAYAVEPEAMLESASTPAEEAKEEAKDKDIKIETMTIIGTRSRLPGVATTLATEDLERFSITDAHKLLSLVPGVHFRSEEGYGLRPNIGIRGTPNERSSKITIMEDGILMAPAPYSAASAYYFPTMGRMSGVEVVKGPAALTEGPYTIGGAINLISTQIPTDPGWHANIRQELGGDKLSRTKASVGFSQPAGISGLIETHLHKTDGFDSIARSANKTGFNINDYVGKLRFLREREHVSHTVDLKYSIVRQRSPQTYVGLTEADFRRNAHERYGLTAYDEFNNKHRSASLRYSLQIKNFKFQTTVFENRLTRAWLKVEDLALTTNSTLANYQATPIGSVLTLANNGNADAIGVLSGTRNALIRLRNNAREYASRGLSLHAAWTLGAHELQGGWRSIEDSEDRFQRYQFTYQSAGQLGPLTGDGAIPSSSNNRITKGQGTAAFLQDIMTFDAWSIRLGVRHEKYNLNESRYEDGAARTSATQGYPRVLADDSATLFGGGILWAASPSVEVFLGFHQGFTPTQGTAPETADNWEMGARFQHGTTRIEAALFNSNYKNIVGQCSSSNQGAGAGCEPGTQFGGGRATIRGVEFYAKHIVKIRDDVLIPLSLSYSYTDSAFKTTFNHTQYWGEVQIADAIPYLPKHQVVLRAGIQVRNWNFDLQRLSYSKTCAVAACSPFTTIEAWHNYDLRMAQTFPNKNLTFYGALQNLTNKKNIVSRNPNNGARAQQSRTLLIGVNYEF